MSGIFGEKMSHLLMSTVVDDTEPHSTGRAFDDRYKEQIRSFVDDYDENEPFHHVAGRKLRGIPRVDTFSSVVRIRGPFSMGQYLKSRSRQMDSFDRVAKATAARRAGNIAPN